MGKIPRARGPSIAIRRLAPAAMLAAALCLPASAGVTIHVDLDAPPGGDGMSWKNPLIDLQAALDMVLQLSGQAIEVRLAAGTYVPTARIDEGDPRSATFKLVDGIAILGGFAGFGEPDPDARDIDKYETILSGDLNGDDGPPGSFTNTGDNTYHVVTAIDILDDATALDGVTITAGNACCIDDQFDTRGFGGGLYAVNVAMMVIDCTIEYNSGYTGGGAHFSECDPILIGCKFHSNRGVLLPTYSSPQGGAAYFRLSTPVLEDCTFTNNTAKSGGATFHHFGSTVVSACAFNDNTAQGIVPTAGAIWAAAETLHISDSVFDGNTSHGDAGAMRLSDCNTTIEHCDFVNNDAENRGAIYAIGSELLITDSHFLGNEADGYAGAIGVMVEALTIRECVFEANTCPFWGGAIFADGLAGVPLAVVISNCGFFDNATSPLLGAGGALILGSANGAISNCTFLGNTSSDGGALNLDFNQDTEFSVIDCDFESNVAAGRGGAVRSDGGSPRFDRCRFASNIAEDGGAMAISSSPGIVNCLFANNAASFGFGGQGGAIRAILANSQLVNCTLVGNSAESGGSVSSGSDFSMLTFSNCVVWGNGLGAFLDADASKTIVWRSDVQGGWNGPGGWNIDADPLFVDAAAADYRLAQGSPCIDSGDNDALPFDSMTDLDGLPRFVDDQTAQNTGHGDGPLTDMGAYERQIPAGSCPADCAHPVDNIVNISDVLAVIDDWGASRGPTDINSDGAVDVVDLLLVISAWGTCP